MIRTSSLLFISLLTLMSCKIVDDDPEQGGKNYVTYRISTSEASGWFEASASDGGWVPFSKATMNTLVDGEAGFYTNEGMVEGAQQVLTNSAGEKLNTWICDFSTNSAAALMFQKIKADKVTTPKTVTGFDESVAIINTTGEGCCAYAIFGQFIIRASFENYGDINKSYTDAAQFLQVYKKK